MITELGKSAFFLHITVLFSVIVLTVISFSFIYLAVSEGLPSWHCFECVLFVVLVEIDCLVLAFLNVFFFHAASVNLWSHSSDLPAVSIAPFHQFIFFGLGPHLLGLPSPSPNFSLLFSLSFFFSFCYLSLLSVWWTYFSNSTGSPRSIRYQNTLPQHHIFP